MEIMITDRLRVRQEPMTLVMEEMVTVAATAKAPAHDKWVRVGFYGTLDGCCEKAVMLLLAQRDETVDVKDLVRILRETIAFVRESFGRPKHEERLVALGGGVFPITPVSADDERSLAEPATFDPQMPIAQVQAAVDAAPKSELPMDPRDVRARQRAMLNLDESAAQPPAPRGRSPRKLE